MRVLVIGATRGIGLEVAELAAARGDEVVISGRDQSRVDAAVARIGRGARGYASDAADPRAIEKLFTSLSLEGPLLDVVIANAAIAHGGWFATMEPHALDEMLALNVRGLTSIVRESLRHLAPQGVIVIVSSTFAIDPFPGVAMYSATKAFGLALAEAVAEEEETVRRRVRIGVAVLGAVETDIRSEMSAELQRALDEGVAERIPLRRAAEIVLEVADDASVGEAHVFVEEHTTH